MNIDIVGAGIGGLTTAIALEKKGINVKIYEQAKQIKQVGAGIILANNAMQVYDKLGLREQIEQHGYPISSMKITRADLNPLSNIDLTYFEKKHNTKNIAIHRGVLQQLLINTLQTTKLQLGHKLTSITPYNEAFVLKFENNNEIRSSIVIGADGLNSRVRQNLFPPTRIRNANQICWRGIAEFNLPEKYQKELNEAWGKSARFGFVQIDANKVYWYALKAFKKKKEELSIDDLEKYYSKFNPLVKDIIKSTKKEQINTAEMSDLKPTKFWHKGNVCLIGDSAHATTPNMGQGACQAIEDAYVLSECLSKFEHHKAFTEYQKLRLPKAHQVVKASWFVGKMAHISNPLLAGMRNQILKLTPSSMNRKQNEQLFQLAKIPE